MKSRNNSILYWYKKGLEISKGFKLSYYILCFCATASFISGYVYASDELPDPTEFLVASSLSVNQDYLDASDILFNKTAESTFLNTEKKASLLSAGIVIPGKQSNSSQGNSELGKPEQAIDSVKDPIITKEELTQENVMIVGLQPIPEEIERKLWKTRITSPKEVKDKAQRDELSRLIEQIRSIEFKDETQLEPLIIIEKQDTRNAFSADANNILHKSEGYSNAKGEQAGSGESLFMQTKEGTANPEILTEESLQLLESLSKQPEQIGNPLGLADILYRSRQLHYAGIFYNQALKLADEGKEEKNNIEWILFQAGNCLAEEDPAASLKIYRRMINEYPRSAWKDIAGAKEKLVSWYLKDNPKSLINPQ